MVAVVTPLPLTIVSQTALKLTVGWTPPAGVEGYEFLRDGGRVSSSWDPAKKQVTFWIPDSQPHTFEVRAVSGLASGTVTVNQPAGGDPAAAAFQKLWDATVVPGYGWDAPKVVTSQAALDAALAAATAGTRIQPRGFVYRGRLALLNVKGPVWIDADPTLEIVGPAGVYGQGIWTVDCDRLYITGFPRVHNCGNQGLLDQGTNGCFYELDVRDCGGTAVLTKKSDALTTDTTFKVRGGNCGLDLTLDPHPQPGTGNHFMNSWQIQRGLVILDIDDQPYGAGFESTWLNGTRIAIRAKSLSCNVDTLPAPNGIRQTAGNAWQPWDASPGGPHVNCVVEAISVGSCAQGVYGALGNAGNTGNVVKVGRVGTHRKSPVWAPLPGVTYLDVA